MIVNKISIGELDMLSDTVSQLAKACGISNNIASVFSSLPIIIITIDFYQFSPIEEHIF